MTAAARNRDTRELALLAEGAAPLAFPMAAATTIYAGTLVASDAAGRGVPASASSALRIWGRAEKQVVNTVAAGYGAADALTVEARPGVFAFIAGEAITRANIGQAAYADDDQTVYLSPGTGRPRAGIIFGLLGSEVLVGVGPIFDPEFGDGGGAALSSLPAFAAGTMTPAATALVNGGFYDVPTTAANSTIVLPAASPVGTVLHFGADGTKNGHTVQYVDATGSVNLTTALTASKRHQCTARKLSSTVWVANAYVSP